MLLGVSPIPYRGRTQDHFGFPLSQVFLIKAVVSGMNTTTRKFNQGSNNKVRFLAAVLVLANVAFTPVESHADKLKDDTWKIAMSSSIPGKMKYNQCSIFAQTLYKEIVKRGGEAHHISYQWRDQDGNADQHAMVVYRDAKGRFWGMDNMARKPRWLSGKNPSQWAQSFSNAPVSKVSAHSSYVTTQVVRHSTERSTLGQYASYQYRPSVSVSGWQIANK